MKIEFHFFLGYQNSFQPHLKGRRAMIATALCWYGSNYILLSVLNCIISIPLKFKIIACNIFTSMTNSSDANWSLSRCGLMKSVLWEGTFTPWRQKSFRCHQWGHGQQANVVPRIWVTYSMGDCFWESLAMCFKHSLGGSGGVPCSSVLGSMYSHPAAGKSIWNKGMIWQVLKEPT